MEASDLYSEATKIIGSAVIGVIGTLLVQKVNSRRRYKDTKRMIVECLRSYIDHMETVADHVGHERGDLLIFDPPTSYIDAHLPEIHQFGNNAHAIMQIQQLVKDYVARVNTINNKPLNRRFPEDKVMALQHGFKKMAAEIAIVIDRIESS